MSWNGKRILVTGGLGFIGSNLSVRLAEAGADVTVVDSQEPGCGANLANLDDIALPIRLVQTDIADVDKYPELLEGLDAVFNLAGEIAHTRSMQDPLRDLRLNGEAQLRFLLALHRGSPGVRVVYAGTRQVYGIPQYLPVDEDHPIVPVDFNGIHKLAASMYHELLTRQGMLDCVVLRLTNVYGPRLALNQPAQGVLGQFFRRALLGQPICVFGDGQQLRDPLYVDDAVSAFELLATTSKLPRRTYNVGGPQALTLSAIAEQCAAAGPCALQVAPFPEEHRRIDIGSFTADSRRLAEDFGWQPKITFAEGLQKSLAFFRAHPHAYLPVEEAEAVLSRAANFSGSVNG